MEKLPGSNPGLANQQKKPNKDMRNMKKQILLSIIAIGMIAAFLSAGTFAYFTDTETSSDNTFTAGTFADLKLLDNDEDWGDGVTATWTATDMKPGQEFLFSVKRVGLAYYSGTVPPDSLEITCDYSVIEESPQTESDTDPETNLHPDAMAKQMIITRFMYDGTDYLSSITDFDNDGNKTFHDLKQTPVANLPLPTTPPNGGTFFRLSVKFSENAGNDFQGDTFDLTMIFTLKQ